MAVALPTWQNGSTESSNTITYSRLCVQNSKKRKNGKPNATWKYEIWKKLMMMCKINRKSSRKRKKLSTKNKKTTSNSNKKFKNWTMTSILKSMRDINLLRRTESGMFSAMMVKSFIKTVSHRNNKLEKLTKNSPTRKPRFCTTKVKCKQETELTRRWYSDVQM